MVGVHALLDYAVGRIGGPTEDAREFSPSRARGRVNGPLTGSSSGRWPSFIDSPALDVDLQV